MGGVHTSEADLSSGGACGLRFTPVCKDQRPPHTWNVLASTGAGHGGRGYRPRSVPGGGGGGMPDSSGTRSKVLGVVREVRSCRGNFPEASSYLHQEIGRRQGGVSNSPRQLCDVGGQGTGGGKAGQRGGAAWATEHRGSHRHHRQKVRTC